MATGATKRSTETVDRNEITVSEYLDDWIEDHSMEIKLGMLEDYRITIRHYYRGLVRGDG
jgi:integrase